MSFFSAESCEQCQEGYLTAKGSRGRTGLFEVLGPDLEPVGLTLAEDGLFKAAAGLTGLPEMLRALN